MYDPIVVFVTASSKKEAESIGRHLVSEKLAACANMIHSIRSLFFWKGELCDENEVLLLLKSRKNLLNKIVRRVKELHSYDVPEIIGIPIIGGSEDYLEWLEASIL